MNRGGVVVAALPGDTGKPRPAVVPRSDHFAAHHRVVVIPITSELQDAAPLRVDLAPSVSNRLRVVWQAMIDRIASTQNRQSAPRDSGGKPRTVGLILQR